MNARTRIKSLAAVGMLWLAGMTGLSGTATAQTSMTLSNWVPPTHWLPKEVLLGWTADVRQATAGKVSINMLPKAVGSPPQHWELARKGVADVTWGNFTYEPERFKHVWFVELPMMGSNAEAGSVALWRTYEKFLAGNDAFKGVVVLGVAMFGGGQFHHPSKLIDSPDDLKGQKVRMGGPIQKRLLEGLGAVPVSAPATKAYEMLEGGAIDASLHPIESVVNFRLNGKLKQHSIVPEGLYDAAFFLVMNEGKFKALAPAEQQAIMKVSGEALSRRWGKAFDDQNKAAEAKMRAEGHVFGKPNAALLEQIRAARDAALKDLQQEGPSFGVKDYAAMVSFYEQQYKSLAK
jgi:TRAP-type C4-dicarboxylate transport system substrate-binding protein